MSSSVLSVLPWFVSSLLFSSLQIASAVILLKERHLAPWLMLTGSAMALIGQTGSLLIQAFLMGSGHFQMGSGRFQMQYVIATYALATLGHLLFCIGLLLHALHQRAKADRIAQLEAILESRNS